MKKAPFLPPVLQCLMTALLLAFASVASAAYTNGIYAEFSTSMGSYTSRLEYASAPKAVANFIGLATGKRAWLDEPAGRVRTNNLYNGTIFHRVSPGFVIQGGSPNGDAAAGPGYVLTDEFTNTMRHDAFGALSMANSGPDSSGSQFFVTVRAASELNDHYTMFGRLYGGSNVVYKINHVAIDGSERPLTNVTLQSIVIQRVGAAAQAFDINAQSLPLVTNLPLKIAAAGPDVLITFSNRLFADNRFYIGANLKSWSQTPLGIETATPVGSMLIVAASGPAGFFRMNQVQYPSSTFSPKNVLGRTFSMNLAGFGSMIFAFDGFGGGADAISGFGSGAIFVYDWQQQPYNGRFSLIFFSNFYPTTMALNYDSPTNGTVSATVLPNYPSGVGATSFSGTFVSP